MATACNKSWTATDRCCCFPRMSSWCKRKVCQARVGSASVGPLTRAIRALAPGPTVAVTSFGTWMAKQSSMAVHLVHHRAHQSTHTCACSRASSQSQPSLQPEQRWRRLKMIGSVAPSATAPPASAEHVMAMMAYERAVQQRGASQSETKRSQGLCAHVVPRAAAHVSAVFCVGRHRARVLAQNGCGTNSGPQDMHSSVGINKNIAGVHIERPATQHGDHKGGGQSRGPRGYGESYSKRERYIPS